MSAISKLARNGSCTSTASSGSSVDTSSHNHFLNIIRSSPSLQSWLDEAWSPVNHRHERIATGLMTSAIAVSASQMIGMHVHQAPDVRGILDCLPHATKQDMGFRERLATWPPLKQESVRQKLGTWPLSKNEALLAKQYPAKGDR